MTIRYRRGLICLIMLAAWCALLPPVSAQGAAEIPDCASAGIVPPAAANAHMAGEYPLLSEALGEQGDTRLDIVVKQDGSVGAASVLLSSGSLRLDDAAMETVKKNWRYRPATQNGQPVTCRWKVQVLWRLRESLFADMPDNPSVIVKMKPEDYPAEARARGEQGAVVLMVLYSKEGKLQKVDLVKSSGYPDLDAASTALALSRLRAGNASYDGNPVKTVVLLVMVWAL